MDWVVEDCVILAETDHHDCKRVPADREELAWRRVSPCVGVALGIIAEVLGSVAGKVACFLLLLDVHDGHECVFLESWFF